MTAVATAMPTASARTVGLVCISKALLVVMKKRIANSVQQQLVTSPHSPFPTHHSLFTIRHSLPARGHCFGRHAQNFEHHRGSDQRGGPARIEWRRDLDDIAADQVEATQLSDHDLRLDDGHSATFRRAGA